MQPVPLPAARLRDTRDRPAAPGSASRSLAGAVTALPTPFAGGRIDCRALERLVERQIAAGLGGLAVGGAIGEAPTLTADETDLLIDSCVRAAAGRVPVLAGICTNATQAGIEAARRAEAGGADGLLLATPAYNRPLQAGVVLHVEAIARAVSLPIILVNEPGRTRIDLTVETIRRLSESGAIAGLLDHSGDPRRAHAYRMGGGSRLALLAGDDSTALAFQLAGGQGSVSGLANVAPGLWSDLQAACRTGDWRSAMAIQARLMPLMDALALEGDPATTKFALSLVMPGFSPALRAPLLEVAPATAAAIRTALAALAAD